MIIDLRTKNLTLKQKESCKYYQIRLDLAGRPENEDLPNVADIFDLWPYLMYFNETQNKETNSE